jgi:hypothetical protein
MNGEMKVDGWWSFLRAVLFNPTWELMTTGTVFTVLSVGTWWRDNFASDEWKKKLDLNGFLPHWHPAWWVCIGLVVLILVLVRASHRLWKFEREKVYALEAGPIPELVFILTTNNRQQFLGVELKNVSRTDNLLNASIGDSKSTVGNISWHPSTIPYLQANGGLKLVEPFLVLEPDGQKDYITNLDKLGKTIIDKIGSENVELIKFFVMAQDARDIYYAFSAELRFYCKINHWVIGPTKRERLRRLTDEERLRKPQTWSWLKRISSRRDKGSPV